MPDCPSGCRQAKPISDGRKGINLGYASSMKNILFWDLKTEKVRECLHVIFDEAMNDLPYDEKPPNARLLDCLCWEKAPMTKRNVQRTGIWSRTDVGL